MTSDTELSRISVFSIKQGEISALDPASSGLGSGLFPIMSLSSLVCEWVLASLYAVGNAAVD